MKIKGFKLGATGQHPYGKASADDEGELRMAMAADVPNGIVRVEFGTPTAWIGLPPKEAREMAAALTSKAAEIEKEGLVLANVSGGDWTKQTPEWQEAAARWRDHYFAAVRAAASPRADTPST